MSFKPEFTRMVRLDRFGSLGLSFVSKNFNESSSQEYSQNRSFRDRSTEQGTKNKLFGIRITRCNYCVVAYEACFKQINVFIKHFL